MLTEQTQELAALIANRIEARAEQFEDFIDDDGDLWFHDEAIFADCFDDCDDALHEVIRRNPQVETALVYLRERVTELAESRATYQREVVQGSVYSQLRYYGMNVKDFV